MNKIIVLVLVCVVASVVALLAFSGYTDKLFLLLFPCEQNPADSAPCTITQSALTFVVAAFMATASLIWLAVELIKRIVKNAK